MRDTIHPGSSPLKWASCCASSSREPEHVGTAALGCPVERSSTHFGGRTEKHSGAPLRRTAGAAVPTCSGFGSDLGADKYPAGLCYNSLAMSSQTINTFLVPEKTLANAKGDGPALEIGAAASRVFLLTLDITNMVEQEALDVSVYGSADGAAWGAKPLIAFPQKFYRGQHPMLLDVSGHAEVKFIRAHWEVNRWGRGTETPMFEFHLTIREVPPEILKEATAEAKALA